MPSFSFRVRATTGHVVVEEITGIVPPGIYQVSGHDNGPEANASNQVSIAIVQHDENGAAVVGASGYTGA